jgi:hypothetical protein
VTVLAAGILLVGCSQAAPSVDKQQKREGPEWIEKAPSKGPSPDLPAYDITLEQDCAETGVVGKCYDVSTDATSREELEVITADLWLDSPGYLAVLVTFYPNNATTDVSAWGFAFGNEQAARVVLAQSLVQGTSVEDEVREAMGNGGIYVVVPADEAQELTQETATGRAEEVLGGWRTPTAFGWPTQAGTTPRVAFPAVIMAVGEVDLSVTLQLPLTGLATTKWRTNVGAFRRGEVRGVPHGQGCRISELVTQHENGRDGRRVEEEARRDFRDNHARGWAHRVPGSEGACAPLGGRPREHAQDRDVVRREAGPDEGPRRRPGGARRLASP